MEESKSRIGELFERGEAEKKVRRISAWQRAEGVVVERERLVGELEKVRMSNKQLQDERDELQLIVSVDMGIGLWIIYTYC